MQQYCSLKLFYSIAIQTSVGCIRLDMSLNKFKRHIDVNRAAKCEGSITEGLKYGSKEVVRAEVGCRDAKHLKILFM